MNKVVVPLPRLNYLKIALGIVMQLSGTAYPVILGLLNHLFINPFKQLLNLLSKLRHGIQGKQVKFSLGLISYYRLGLGILYIYAFRYW